MRIGLVEFLLILAIASLTIGPQVALFVDRWLRRANRVNARAARRRAEYAAQAAAERDALLKRFRTASTVFGVCILLALVYTLVFRPIDTPPQAYDAPAVRQDTGAAQTALATDDKGTLDLGGYQNVDCIRARDGLVYAAACDGAALKKCSSDLVRTDGGHTAAVLTVDGQAVPFPVGEGYTVSGGQAVFALRHGESLTFTGLPYGGVVTVTEDEICAAILALIEQHKLIAEGAGAVSVAAAMFNKVPVKGCKTVCVVSGGNIDVTILSRVINRGLSKSGRIYTFCVELDDKPGQLFVVSQIAASVGANIISVYHERNDDTSNVTACWLRVQVETRNAEHVQELQLALKNAGLKLI